MVVHEARVFPVADALHDNAAALIEPLAIGVHAVLNTRVEGPVMVVGSGPSADEMESLCRRRNVADRVHLVGVKKGQELVDSYHAMDVFAFASTSETQGMVLTEAMAAGVPVVAIDAPGAREVVRDGVNGRLLPSQNARSFTQALEWFAAREHPERLQQAARETAEKFSMGRCAARAAPTRCRPRCVISIWRPSISTITTPCI